MARVVVCVENTGDPASLEVHKIYRVVPDADAAQEGDLRIVDESGEDYLYPAEWFAALELPRRVKELAASSATDETGKVTAGKIGGIGVPRVIDSGRD